MPVIVDDTGSVGGLGGLEPDATAAYTYLGGEPTVYAFVPNQPEQATRFSYRADQSGVGYTLVVSGLALKDPGLIATVAGQLAAAWNANALVPGVVDIAETQDVKPLGDVIDVYEIAVTSTNGRTTDVLTLGINEIRPDIFAELVAAKRAELDRFG